MLKEYTLNPVIAEQLDSEISASGYVGNYQGIGHNGATNKISVYGDSLINETGLDQVIADHTPNFIPGIVHTTVHANKVFADNLMQELKERNILEGLASLDQAAWVHHRLRKMDYTMTDTTTIVQLDLMNLVVSGDIETAEQALGQMSADDMTEAYHWLNQDRIDWIRNEIRNYLGWPLL